MEADLTTYEKKIEDQLMIPTATLWQAILIQPKWGVKKNSDGKTRFDSVSKGI